MRSPQQTSEKLEAWLVLGGSLLLTAYYGDAQLRYTLRFLVEVVRRVLAGILASESPL